MSGTKKHVCNQTQSLPFGENSMGHSLRLLDRIGNKYAIAE